MERYRLEFKKSAVKELRDLESSICRRLVAKIGALASDPRSGGAEKLSGEEKYRIRDGRYRVLYEIDDIEKVVRVVRIAHRREAYR